MCFKFTIFPDCEPLLLLLRGQLLDQGFPNSESLWPYLQSSLFSWYSRVSLTCLWGWIYFIYLDWVFWAVKSKTVSVFQKLLNVFSYCLMKFFFFICIISCCWVESAKCSYFFSLLSFFISLAEFWNKSVIHATFINSFFSLWLNTPILLINFNYCSSEWLLNVLFEFLRSDLSCLESVILYFLISCLIKCTLKSHIS